MPRNRRFSLAYSLNQLLRFVLPAAIIAMSAADAKGQAPAITEGSRIQVSATGLKNVTGIVRSISGDSTAIYVDGQAGVLKFANRDISELKVSVGRTRAAGARKGLIWGAGIGGALAVAILASPDNQNNYQYQLYSTNRLAASTFIGSLVWGIGLGTLIKAEEWKALPVHPAVAASSGGMGLSLAFSPSFLH